MVMALSACTYHVQQSQPLLDADKISTIQKGKTSRADVEAMLGPAANTGMGANGERYAMYYSYQIASTGHSGFFMSARGTASTRSQNLQILYSSSGIVKDFEFTDRTDNTQSRFGMGGYSVQTNSAPTPSK